MNETNKFEYLCELCQGLTPFRRIRCKECGKMFCKYHIKDHKCIPSKEQLKELALKRLGV